MIKLELEAVYLTAVLFKQVVRTLLRFGFNTFIKQNVSTLLVQLRWLNTVLAVCEYMSFVKSWQEKGCSSQSETWQVKNILMKDFDRQVKCDVFVVSMAT